MSFNFNVQQLGGNYYRYQCSSGVSLRQARMSDSCVIEARQGNLTKEQLNEVMKVFKDVQAIKTALTTQIERAYLVRGPIEYYGQEVIDFVPVEELEINPDFAAYFQIQEAYVRAAQSLSQTERKYGVVSTRL